MTPRQDGPARPGDAFGLTADPSAYVPRLSLETALTALQEAIAKPPACAALIGEAGLGKTLLLRVLAERVEGAFESLYVPFPRLETHELFAWLAAALGVAGSGDDRLAVLAHAQRSRDDGMGLLLLVDDAGALPPETRTELVGTCRAPGLALVMAFSTDDRALVAELPADVKRVELGPPMTLPELRAYVRTRLRRVDPSGVVSARIGAGRLAELHEASGGVPARVHLLLDAWLRGRRAESVSPGVAARPAAARPVVPVGAAPLPPDVEDEDPAAPSAARVERGPRRRTPPREEEQDRPAFFRRSRRRSGVRFLPAVALVLLLAGVWYATSEPRPPLPVEVPPERTAEAPAPLPEPAIPPPLPEPLEPAPPEPPPLAEAPSPPAPTADAPTFGEPTFGAPAPEPPPVAAAPTFEPAEAAPVEPPAPPAPEPLPDVAAAPPPEPAPEPPPVREPERPAPAPEPVLEPEPAPAVLSLPVRPPRPGARLSVNASPWAEIRVDGRSLGQTPLGEVPLTPGPHRVTATMPDGSVIERTVDARSGDVFLTFP